MSSAWVRTVCSVFFAVLVLAPISGRADQLPNDADASGHLNQIVNEVHGRIGLQKRSTFVPYACTVEMGCPQSQTYWVMTVTADNGVLYEFKKPFGFGLDRAPEAIQAFGVVLRPGLEVVLQGETEPVTPSYSLITGVDWIRVLN